MSCQKVGTYELLFKYIHKSCLPKKWGGNYNYMKQDFLVTSFWLPTLSTVKYSSVYVILCNYGTAILDNFVSELIEYMCINTRELKGP